MAKQNKNTYAKRTKELGRKRKADEKMARRQNKKREEGSKEIDTPVTD
ncbi:MAG TPA: hypothetical protein PLK94_07445 [Alphaproteobacteria bacterium]|nr:hypothetical protein [Alphaproteobacteria bacterium]